MRTETLEGGAAGAVGKARLDTAALDQLYHQARTHNAFINKDVPDALLNEAVELTVQGPTAANSLPFRVVFVRSPEAKARLEPTLSEGNRAKTIAAPVTAILAYDRKFYDHLPRLFPHADARSWFASNDAFADATARTNGTLQAGYFILALRALGLDAGPMAGFDNAKVDAEFFAGTDVKSNVLINIGFGDTAKLFPRSPRFSFDQIASFA